MSFVFPSRGLVRLIYVSRSNIPASEQREAVRQILIKSISNNRNVDVTGQLITQGRHFMQLLEGPAARVRETYDRVVADTRHGAIRLLVVGAASERLFRDWNMSERHLPNVADEIFEHISSDAALELFAAGRLALT